MNRFAAKYAVVIALFISLGGEAHAQPREVLVVASANRCIDAQLLASAIHRDTSLPVRVVTADVDEEAAREGAAVRRIVVDVKGQGEELLVELRGTEPEVSQPLRATACETASDVAAAFVASVLAPPPPVVVPPAPDARAQATELQEKNDAVAQRAALMVEDLDSEIRARWIAPPVLRIILASVGTAGAALGFYNAANTGETSAYLRAAGPATWVLGAVTSFVVPEEYAPIVSSSSVGIGSGLMMMGLGRGAGEAGLSPYGVAGLSGAMFLQSALIIGGAVARRPVSRATLVADYALIGSPERRSALTADQLARIEEDLRRASSPLPPWLLAAPLLAGGSVALGAAFADPHSSDLSRVIEGAGGVAFLALGVLTLFPQSGFPHYEKLLEQNGLRASVRAAPGQNLSFHIHGTF
jgi:hypothetical protein